MVLIPNPVNPVYPPLPSAAVFLDGGNVKPGMLLDRIYGIEMEFDNLSSA